MQQNFLLPVYKTTFLLLTILMVAGCQNAYYATMEKVGVHKRDILVDRVQDAQASQQEAQQQFKSALEQLTELIQFEGAGLEQQFRKTEQQYQACNAAAADVSKRINAIESVAAALFKEWQDELDQYTNAKLKQDSAKKLADTERRYKSLLSSMRKAEQKMTPVLNALKDNTLYLKHNLNAQAIGALQSEFQSIKQDIESLLSEMNTAIAQSSQFIESLQ